MPALLSPATALVILLTVSYEHEIILSTRRMRIGSVLSLYFCVWSFRGECSDWDVSHLLDIIMTYRLFIYRTIIFYTFVFVSIYRHQQNFVAFITDFQKY